MKRLGTFLGTLFFGSLALFSLVVLFKCGGAACPPFVSHLASQDASDVSYPGRSWELKLYFTLLFKMKFLFKMASVWFLLILGTYLPGTGVIDKGLVGTKMDA